MRNILVIFFISILFLERSSFVPEIIVPLPMDKVKLYRPDFSVTIVSQGNHDNEKGDHIHGGDHRLDRAEKLGSKNYHQHIIEVTQHNRAGQLILQRAFPEKEYSNKTIDSRQHKGHRSRHNNHTRFFFEKRRVAVENAQVDQRKQ